MNTIRLICISVRQIQQKHSSLYFYIIPFTTVRFALMLAYMYFILEVIILFNSWLCFNEVVFCWYRFHFVGLRWRTKVTNLPQLWLFSHQPRT